VSLRCLLSPLGERDLEEATVHLRDHAGADVALRFVSAAAETFALLARHPEIGREYAPRDDRLAGMRAFRIHRFEQHLVFYRVEADAIRIERVLHGSRDLWALLGLDGIA
jgi:toxin ParE1/3/4